MNVKDLKCRCSSAVSRNCFATNALLNALNFEQLLTNFKMLK